MTQEFVMLPRHVAEHAVASIEMLNTGKWAQVTALAAALRAALDQPQGEQEPAAEHKLKDVRCECCGYMTHNREHMGCIRAAHAKRDPLTDAEIGQAVRWLYQDHRAAEMGLEDDIAVARAIEAAHNIK